MLDEILAQFDHVCFTLNDFKILEIKEGMVVYIIKTMNSFIKERDCKKNVYIRNSILFYFSSVPDHSSEGPG
jgi:hypothetical protein